MNPQRQAALAVHGLNENDQRWLLEQLNAEERSQLTPLLYDLRSLGIPADPGMVADIARVQPAAAVPVTKAEPANAASAPPEPDPDAPGAKLRAAQVDALLAVLAGEPLPVVKTVLALEDWPWRTAFIERLGRERPALLAGDAKQVVAPKLAAALVAALEARLAGLSKAPAATEETRLPKTSAARVAAIWKRARGVLQAWT